MASLSKYEAYEFKSSVYFVVAQRCVFQTPIEFLQLIRKSIIFGQIGDDLAGAVESQAFAHGLSQDLARIEFQHAHSFGTYASKLHDWAWVVDQMGNSVSMLLKHYRDASVTKEDAKAYFEISPTNIGETAKIMKSRSLTNATRE